MLGCVNYSFKSLCRATHTEEGFTWKAVSEWRRVSWRHKKFDSCVQCCCLEFSVFSFPPSVTSRLLSSVYEHKVKPQEKRNGVRIKYNRETIQLNKWKSSRGTADFSGFLISSLSLSLRGGTEDVINSSWVCSQFSDVERVTWWWMGRKRAL